MKKIFYFIFFYLTLCSAQKNVLVVTEQNKSEYIIVTPSDANNFEKTAATVLQKYILGMTGVKLPVYNDSEVKQEKEILIGRTNRTYNKLTEKSDSDGYIIRTDNNKIYIQGGNEKGVIYAVYNLLEMWGCRKYSPEVTIIPKTDKLLLNSVYKKSDPAFTFRSTNYFNSYDEEYALWHGLDHHNGPDTEWGMWVHTFDDLIPAAKYYKTNPEYFSERKGVKNELQLCLTNPDLKKELIKNLTGKIKSNPQYKYWSVSQNDNYGNCDCADCAKIDSLEGSNSGTMINFVNDIAKEFPAKIISTLAYQYTRKAPEKIKPQENVNIMLCSIECNRSKPIETDPTCADFKKDVEDWGRLTNNIIIWDYVIQFTNMVSPFPNLHVIQPNIQFYAKNGVKMMFQQGCNMQYSEMGDLRCYLISKLLWNPDANTDSLMNDFLSGYYGKAAPYIKEYINTIHDELVKCGERLDIYGNPSDGIKSYMSPQLMDKYENLFKQAMEVTKDNPVVNRLVRISYLPVLYARVEQAKRYMQGDLGFFVKNNEGSWILNNKMMDKLEEFRKACDEFQIKMVEENNFTPKKYLDIIDRVIKNSMQNKFGLTKKVTLNVQPHNKYFANGAATLTDGIMGTENYKFNWLGYEAEDCEAIIDLEKIINISRIKVNYLQDTKSWIFMPVFVDYYVSEDGDNYKYLGRINNTTDEKIKNAVIKDYTLELDKIPARYIKVKIKNLEKCPSWHNGAGGKSWIFTDEIIIE